MRKSVGVLVFLASAVCVSPPGNAQNAKETVNSLLQEMGCEAAQGYYFARPMPESDVIALLNQWTPLKIGQ